MSKKITITISFDAEEAEKYFKMINSLLPKEMRTKPSRIKAQLDLLPSDLVVNITKDKYPKRSTVKKIIDQFLSGKYED